MTEPSDVALLAAWQGGESAAGDRLMKRYYRGVLRFFELKAQWDAEDLVQKTFLGCLHARDRLGPEDSFKGYLFGIARHQLQMYLRSSLRRDRLTSLAASSPTTAPPGFTTLATQHQEQQALLQGLVSLPEESQTLLSLFYWEGLTSAELGRAMGIPAATVRGRLARTRQQLYDAVGQANVPMGLRHRVQQNFDEWARSLAAPSSPESD